MRPYIQTFKAVAQDLMPAFTKLQDLPDDDTLDGVAIMALLETQEDWSLEYGSSILGVAATIIALANRAAAIESRIYRT